MPYRYVASTISFLGFCSVHHSPLHLIDTLSLSVCSPTFHKLISYFSHLSSYIVSFPIAHGSMPTFSVHLRNPLFILPIASTIRPRINVCSTTKSSDGLVGVRFGVCRTFLGSKRDQIEGRFHRFVPWDRDHYNLVNNSTCPGDDDRRRSSPALWCIAHPRSGRSKALMTATPHG